MVLVCKEKVRTRRLSLVGMMAAAQAASDDGCSYKTLIPISNVLAKEVTEGMLVFQHRPNKVGESGWRSKDRVW